MGNNQSRQTASKGKEGGKNRCPTCSSELAKLPPGNANIGTTSKKQSTSENAKRESGNQTLDRTKRDHLDENKSGQNSERKTSNISNNGLTRSIASTTPSEAGTGTSVTGSVISAQSTPSDASDYGLDDDDEIDADNDFDVDVDLEEMGEGPDGVEPMDADEQQLPKTENKPETSKSKSKNETVKKNGSVRNQQPQQQNIYELDDDVRENDDGNEGENIGETVNGGPEVNIDDILADTNDANEMNDRPIEHSTRRSMSGRGSRGRPRRRRHRRVSAPIERGRVRRRAALSAERRLQASSLSRRSMRRGGSRRRPSRRQ